MEVESAKKELKFLEIRTINHKQGRYEFDVFRKEAIRNVQVKPESSHDPRVLRGVFKSFIDRALKICSPNFFNKEIEFLIEVFTENGYQRSSLKKMANEVIEKSRQTPKEPIITESTEQPSKIVTLPGSPKYHPN